MADQQPPPQPAASASNTVAGIVIPSADKMLTATINHKRYQYFTRQGQRIYVVKQVLYRCDLSLQFVKLRQQETDGKIELVDDLQQGDQPIVDTQLNSSRNHSKITALFIPEPNGAKRLAMTEQIFAKVVESLPTGGRKPAMFYVLVPFKGSTATRIFINSPDEQTTALFMEKLKQSGILTQFCYADGKGKDDKGGFYPAQPRRTEAAADNSQFRILRKDGGSPQDFPVLVSSPAQAEALLTRQKEHQATRDLELRQVAQKAQQDQAKLQHDQARIHQEQIDALVQQHAREMQRQERDMRTLQEQMAAIQAWQASPYASTFQQPQYYVQPQYAPVNPYMQQMAQPIQRQPGSARA